MHAVSELDTVEEKPKTSAALAEGRSPATEDWNWFIDQLNERALRNYLGHYVAILSREVVGSNPDPDALERELISRFPQVDLDRFTIEFVG